MNVDYLLEKWCEKKGIDCEKIPEDIWNETVSRTEDDIEEYIREEGDTFVNEWAWLNIEQNLDEHPEWKCQKNKQEKMENEN